MCVEDVEVENTAVGEPVGNQMVNKEIVRLPVRRAPRGDRVEGQLEVAPTYLTSFLTIDLKRPLYMVSFFTCRVEGGQTEQNQAELPN